MAEYKIVYCKICGKELTDKVDRELKYHSLGCKDFDKEKEVVK